jgi:hypothetical protein
MAETRDTLLLSGALVLGVVLSLLAPLIGLPLAAVGAAGLTNRGRVLGAVVGSAVGIAIVGMIDTGSVIFVAPAVIAVMLAVVLLPRWEAQWVGAMLTIVLTVAGAASEYVILMAQGQSLASQLSTQINQAIAADSQLAGMSASSQSMKQAATLTLQLIPTWFFVSGLVMAVAVIVALAWAAKRSGRTVKVTKLSQLDLTPHVLWPFVAGLFALAASHASIANAQTLGVVGLNLVWCSAAVFTLQGLGVSAGVLDRTGVGLGVRILAWAALAVLDVFTVWTFLPFVGLLDFWINFRRLPRDGATPESPTTAMSDRL